MEEIRLDEVLSDTHQLTTRHLPTTETVEDAASLSVMSYRIEVCRKFSNHMIEIDHMLALILAPEP